MNVEEFYKEWLADLKISSQTEGNILPSQFVVDVIDKLIDAEEFDNLDGGYFDAIGPRKAKMTMDGFYFDEADKSCVLIYSVFSNDDELTTFTKTEIDKAYNCLSRLVEAAMDGYITDQNNGFEESSDGYNFAVKLREFLDNTGITKFRFYIVTNKILSDRVKNIKKDPIGGIRVSLNVWDVSRFYQLYVAAQGKEEIEIDVKDFGVNGIPCLKAVKTTDYEAYLAIIPGTLLSDIYLEYGSRLLEGNVRSFLSNRGKVNKSIRRTILEEPKLFFAYNNGIAATATEISTTKREEGLFITRLKDLQIINGGQTTASIANAVLHDKATLDDIYIPVKLSVVDHEKAKQMVPAISRSANSQNKVDEADFFSNHPYHVRLEELSRKILAPAIDGNQYQTAWFYERARGQYVQEQMKLTKAGRRNFQLKNPKQQLIKKVDIAKYVNSFEQKPNIVSKGSQFNMRVFAEDVNKFWPPETNDNTSVNEFYYKELIAKAIWFKETERIISQQEWYQEVKAYRANTVTYTIAIIQYLIETQHPGKSIDFQQIWNTQCLSDATTFQIRETSHEIFKFITRDDRPTLNVTEWCKKPECWERAKKENFTLQDSFINELIDADESISISDSAKREQETTNRVSDEVEIYNLGSTYWKKVLDFARRDALITPTEESLINIVASFEDTCKLPSDKQAKRIMEIRRRLIRENGLPEKFAN